MSTPTDVPSGGGGRVPGGGNDGGTKVIQVTNVSPNSTSEQLQTLFGFLGKIEELHLFPPDDSPLPVSSRVCFVKFHDPDSAVVAQHLTNTLFIDRALIVVPYAGVIPDETKALSLLAPANAVAGLLPGGGLLPAPYPLSQIGAVPLSALGAPALDPALNALGLPGANLNSESLAADQLLKLMSTVDPKLNHVAAGLFSPSLKSDTSSKEIEEVMKKVREAQSLISAAIEPDKKEEKRRHYRSRSRSRSRRTPSFSRHRRSRSRSRRRSHSKSRSRRRSKSPRQRRSHSRERGRRSRSRRSRSASKTRDKNKEEKEKKRSKTPPKSYSTTRWSRSTRSERRYRRSRSGTRSPRSSERKLSRSPSPRRHKKEKKEEKDKESSSERKLSRSPSPRRHKKEKKEEKDKERRDEREGSTSKKKKSSDKEKEPNSKKKKRKDKEKERERKSENRRAIRDYDEEGQGYNSEKEKKEDKKAPEVSSPKVKESFCGEGQWGFPMKVQSDHEEDMDISD